MLTARAAAETTLTVALTAVRHAAPGRDTASARRAATTTPAGPTGTLVLWAIPPADFFVEQDPKGKGVDSVRVTVPANRDQSITIRESNPWLGVTARHSTRVKPGEVRYVGRDFRADASRVDVDTPGRSGAEVLIDGRHTGRLTPATLYVGEGSHRIHVILDGWRSAEGEQTLRFKAGQPKAILFTLQRL
jgi:hypothetical protein